MPSGSQSARCGHGLFCGHLLSLLAAGFAIPALAAETAELRFEFAYMPLQSARGIVSGARGLSLAPGAADATFESAVLAAPFAFTAVGPHWLAEVPSGASMTVQLATSANGNDWSDFHSIDGDPHLVPTRLMPDGSPNRNFGETVGHLVHRARGDGLFVRFRLILARDPATAAAPGIERFTLTFIDSLRPGPMAESGADPGGASTELRGGGYPRPPVNSRVAWGAEPPTCSYSYCNVTHVGVHHTAGVGEYSCAGFDECATDVRAIQAYHMDTNGWCDVGYNYLVSSDGQLWEGRGGGDDVRGAHDGYNCGSMGVANMGYYHPPFDHVWTEAQVDAAAELTAWKADQKGIDPEGVGFYEGLGASLDNIYGHRDVSATACPGDTLYPRLDELKGRVVEKLTGGADTFIYDNPSAQLLIGDWITGTASGDKYGSDYYWANSGGGQYCVWRVDLQNAGDYDIAFWWPQGANRSPSTRLLVKQGGPVQWSTVNQQSDGGQWNSLGVYSLAAGRVLLGVSNAGPTGFVVMCDAVRLQRLE